MSDANTSQIVDRLRKLKALHDHPGTPEHEAAAAAEAMQRILAEHNLSLAYLETSTTVQAERRTREQHGRAAMYNYQQNLMKALARNNFCQHWLDEIVTKSNGKTRRVKRHMLLGRESNVTATKLMYDYLTDTMERVLPYTGMERRGRAAMAWLDGCSDRLVERLDALRAKMEEESERRAQEEKARSRHPASAPTANALIVLSDVYGTEDDLNQDFRYGYEPGTTARKRRERAAKDAARDEKVKTLQATGLPYDVAWAMVTWNWTREKAEEQVKEWKKQRARSERRYQSSWTRADERSHRRKSSAEYAAGRATGDDIGLDGQIDRDDRKTLS